MKRWMFPNGEQGAPFFGIIVHLYSNLAYAPGVDSSVQAFSTMSGLRTVRNIAQQGKRLLYYVAEGAVLVELWGR